MDTESKLFYPLASVFLIINALIYPFVTLSYKWAVTKSKMSLPESIGISGIIVSLISLAIWIFASAKLPENISWQSIASIIYSGLVVSLLSKMLSVSILKQLGSTIAASIIYIQTLLAVVMSVIILNEKLTPIMISGGLLILIGAYTAQYATTHRSAKKMKRRNGQMKIPDINP